MNLRRGIGGRLKKRSETDRSSARAARLACGAGTAAGLLALALAPTPWSVPGGPAFFAVGRPLQHTVAIALWWATAINTVQCLLLGVSAGLWAAPIGPPRPPAAAPAGRAFVAALLLAVAVAAALRWPLAHSGVWADEGWSLRHAVAGMSERSRRDPERLETVIPGWSETVFGWERPTNHPLYNATARISVSAWRRLADREPPAFDELALRLPALLAALACVPLVGLLARELGFARAGAAAAWLLAIHPWHVRYGADGRAYSFMVFFALAAGLQLSRALATGRLRSWLAYALSLALLVWSQPIAVWLAMALGVAALVGSLPGPRPERPARIARAVAAHVMAAMLVLQVMAPNLAQLPEWSARFARGSDATQVSVAGIGHLWALLATGMEAREPEIPERRPGAYPSLADLARERPWVYPVALGVLPALAAAGFLRAAARPGPGRFVVAGLAAGLPLALAGTWALGGQWYSRFGIFELGPLVAFVAIGADGLAARIPWPAPLARVGPAAALALGIAGFAAFTAPQTRVLLSRPHTPSRELAALFLEAGGGDPRGAIHGVLGLPGGNLHIQVYDPWIREIAQREELAALCAESQSTGRPLLVAYGYPRKNRKERPGPFAWLDDPALFREEAVLDAIEVDHLIRVLRYTGDPRCGGES